MFPRNILVSILGVAEYKKTSYFFATWNFWVSVVESLKFQILLFHTIRAARVFIICSFLSTVRGTKNHFYPLKLLIFRSFWIKWCLCNNRSQESQGGGWYQLDIYIVIVWMRKGRGVDSHEITCLLEIFSFSFYGWLSTKKMNYFFATWNFWVSEVESLKF